MSEIKMEKVVSSNIYEVGYDKEKQVLRVKFTNQTVYDYFGVQIETYRQLKASASVGKFFRQLIKGVYAFKKVW